VHGFAQQWSDRNALLQGEEAPSEAEQVEAHIQLLLQQVLQISAAKDALEAKLAAANTACAAATEELSRKDSDIAALKEGCKQRIKEREVLRRERDAARRERDVAVAERDDAEQDSAILADQIAYLNHKVCSLLRLTQC
jgi:chromosome segregation ATPase